MILNGEDVSKAIRQPEISLAESDVGKNRKESCSVKKIILYLSEFRRFHAEIIAPLPPQYVV